jgi:hypothetical protein
MQPSQNRVNQALISKTPLGLHKKERDLKDIQSPLRNCCQDTIRLYAAHNPMILCQYCNHLIKCFGDEVHYKNYVAFCISRNRDIHTAFMDGYYVVVFRNIENFK